MKISTKGRYALRVMIDLAEHQSDNFIPLKEIAHRQEISEKYLESIIKLLVKDNMLIGVRGKGGGYRLTRPASEYTVLDILQSTEESLVPVTCLEENPNPCVRSSECKTLSIWKNLNILVHDYFANITLSDLISKDMGDHYVI